MLGQSERQTFFVGRSFPQAANILVPELGGMSIMTDMVEILGMSLNIHVPRIPVSVHQHALRPPMRPDAEFGVTEPVRTLVLTQ
jgi:hypothetical protein